MSTVDDPSTWEGPPGQDGLSRPPDQSLRLPDMSPLSDGNALVGENVPEPRLRGCNVTAADGGVRGPRLEPVRRAGYDVERGRHPRRSQPRGVLAVLVVEQVDVANPDP